MTKAQPGRKTCKRILPPLFLSSLFLLGIFVTVGAGAFTRQWTPSYTTALVSGDVPVSNDLFGDQVRYRTNLTIGTTNRTITGIRFVYRTLPGLPGPFRLNIRVRGEGSSVLYSLTQIPASTTATWYFYNVTDNYVIDDDPSIEFIGVDPSTTCLLVGYTNSSAGHTEADGGFGWAPYDYDLLVDVQSETIGGFAPNGPLLSGELTETDRADFYQVYLYTTRRYYFTNTYTPAGNKLAIRLYGPHETELATNNVSYMSVTAGSGSGSYLCSQSGTYNVVVQSFSAADIGNYTINVTSNEPGTPTLNPITPTLSTMGVNLLTWNAVPGAGGYYIYRKTVPLDPYDFETLTPEGFTTGTHYFDNVTTSGNYYWGVAAANGDGLSLISSQNPRVLVKLPFLAENFFTAYFTDYAENYEDFFNDIAIDEENEVFYVVGTVNQTFTEGYDIYVGKYSLVTGSLQASKIIDYNFKNDKAYCCAYSSSDDALFVGGTILYNNDQNVVVTKLQASDLSQDWYLPIGSPTQQETIQDMQLSYDETKLALAITSNGVGRIIELDADTSTSRIDTTQAGVAGYNAVVYANRTGSLYAAGYGPIPGTAMHQVKLARYDRDGVFQKMFTYNRTGISYYATSASMSADGETLYATGYRLNHSSNVYEAFVLRFDKNLNLYWETVYAPGSALHGFGFDCLALDDGVLVSGAYNNTQVFYSLDSRQKMLFNTTLQSQAQQGLQSTAAALAKTSDGDVVLAGRLTNPVTGDSDGYFVSYDLPRPINPVLNPLPAVNVNGRVEVTWSASWETYQYELYQNDALVIRTLETGFNVTGLSNGTYTYHVVATNALGNSYPSNAGSVQVVIYTPAPPVILNITTYEDNSDVFLDWTSVTGATLYKVYYSTSPITDANVNGLTPQLPNPSSATNITLQMTQEGDYYFVVRATNASGNSPVSNTVTATIYYVYFRSYTERDVPGYRPVFLLLAGSVGLLVVVWRKKNRVA